MKATTKLSTSIIAILLTCCNLLVQAQEKYTYPFQNPDLPRDVRIEDLIERLTVDEKINLLWERSEAIERLGIKKYDHGNEALHGVVRPGKFTVFPQAIAMAAAWNPDLVFDIANSISDEARGRWNELNFGADQDNYFSDLLTFWSPTINMARDPRWGRTAETYGEDPYLTGRIGVQFVKGLQGDDPNYLKVVSTPKHFVANNEENNRFSCNAIISERSLREYYLPAFKDAIIEGKAESIMSAYNAVNWVPCNANRWLLTDLLRNEWGFEGYVVSDCGGPCNLDGSHGFTPSKEDAAAASIKAGMDLECSGGCFSIKEHLKSALENGKVTMEEINTSTRRVLEARMKLGIFDPIDRVPYNNISPEMVGCEEHQELALEVSRQSIVLLKNENDILPLNNKKLKSIAVVGHNANQIVYGDYSGEALNIPVSPIDGIRNIVGKSAKINFVETVYKTDNLDLIPEDFLTSANGSKGLDGEYFLNTNLEGEAKVRIDKTIDIHSAENKPDPWLSTGDKSMRWSGELKPAVTGTYNLGLTADDGTKLWVDGELLMDNWKNLGESTRTKKIHLEAGKLYKVKIEYFDGGGDFSCRLKWTTPVKEKSDFSAELAAAKKSDMVIAVIGTGLYNEREGVDKEDNYLPGNQTELLQELMKVNKNVVVVLVTGSQHTIPWIQDNCPAIINAWYPGEQGGNAIAEVLFGKYNPAGRLPLTYYEAPETLPEMSRYEISEGRTYMYYKGEPLYSFGFGLSYTTFDYSNIQLSKKGIDKDGELEVSVDIKNTGKRDGDEVAQLYISYPDASVTRPIKQLKGFKRVSIGKGETQTVSFKLEASDMAYWSTKEGNWAIESGKIEVNIGASSDDIRQESSFQIQ